MSLGGVGSTALLGATAVAALARRARPRLPCWLLLEIVIICYLGDLVWQIVQALQRLPVPAREPVGWGLGYTDFSAAVSFCSQATGWSHGLVAVIGLVVAAACSAALAIAATWAWRRGRRDAPEPAPPPRGAQQPA